MASIILGAAGSAVASSFGFPLAGPLFGRVGRAVGSLVDNRLFGGGKAPSVRGPRLDDLAVQTSTYGKMIPIIYGTMRLAGNIIWSRPIKETATTTRSSVGGGKGGGRVSQSSTRYSYSVSVAVAICEGPIDDLLRIWADTKQLDLSRYTLRIYKGDEAQLPDSLIQAFDGVNKTPSYRGLAYVVFEDFPLGDFGNRIPNFTFEVQKKLPYPDYNGEVLEDMIRSMTLIPGAGEYVYDTQVEYKIPGRQAGSGWIQEGEQEPINMHNAYGKANALLALDQLRSTCPNVNWVSVVVSWFGDNMDPALCVVKPGVEYQTGAITSPDTWQVGGYTRATARQITLIGDNPQYGGTPDDDSVLRLLTELRTRGYNIMFYPMMFMDVSGKPWRGDMTGTSTAVSNFFTKSEGYNAFITHYANLVAGRVEAFVIGSELKGLTKVTDTPGSYPAVTQLVNLAATVKTILGSYVKVTYAADWSEYHHADGGWYHMDPLWASPNIDIIGIDAYFPLTDSPQSGYNIDAIKAGWTSGEGYDWYYSDPQRTVQTPLTPPYAWKNIAWFWNNQHINPNSVPTAWVPQSKKIWFTEYGFPSVDGATNQPNVFYDPGSVSSAFPYHSKGRVDFRAQRAGLVATEHQWKNSTMVERMFIWTWEARPYPYWPDLTRIWTDGGVWKTGHWTQGKLGLSSLAAIIRDLCARGGLQASDINVSRLTYQVEGYILSAPQTIRQAIETLQEGYFFDAVESDHILKFVPRGDTSAIISPLPTDDLVPAKPEDKEALVITREQEIDLPRRVNIIYLNRLTSYQAATQYSQRETTQNKEIMTIDLPIVFSDQIAKNVADVRLFSEWAGRTTYRFQLPIRYAQLEPSDLVAITVSGVTHIMRITSIQLQTPRLLTIHAVAEDLSTYDFYTQPGYGSGRSGENRNLATTRLELLDMPAFPGDDTDKATLRLAAVGRSANWTGAAVYRSDDNGASYGLVMDVDVAGVIGNTAGALPSGPSQIFDEASSVSVSLTGNGQLQSASELAVLSGANAAILGDEIIQFKTATLIASGQYTLRGFLRGRLGTEWAIPTHTAGERFVLLDGAVMRQILAGSMIGLGRLYKGVTFNGSLATTPSQAFTYTGIALMPYSPVHIMGERDGSGNLTINWIRRTRLGGPWQDRVDVPLNEESERYEIEIMNGVNVARTISGLTTPTASYSAAQQIADFGSVQSSVSVRVYQLSAMVGRGYPGTATI